jgi:hypothetical protein
MLIHGEKDELIPIHHSEEAGGRDALGAAGAVDGAGHSDVHRFPTMRKA